MEVFNLTLQEWLNENWAALSARVNRPVRTIELGSRCKYRLNGIANDLSPNNCCFIGVTIKPEKYQKHWDVAFGDGAKDVTPELWPELSDAAHEALSSLQEIHDLHDPDTWKDKFSQWLRDNHLTAPE